MLLQGNVLSIKVKCPFFNNLSIAQTIAYFILDITFMDYLVTFYFPWNFQLYFIYLDRYSEYGLQPYLQNKLVPDCIACQTSGSGGPSLKQMMKLPSLISFHGITKLSLLPGSDCFSLLDYLGFLSQGAQEICFEYKYFQ